MESQSHIPSMASYVRGLFAVARVSAASEGFAAPLPRPRPLPRFPLPAGAVPVFVRGTSGSGSVNTDSSCVGRESESYGSVSGIEVNSTCLASSCSCTNTDSVLEESHAFLS